MEKEKFQNAVNMCLDTSNFIAMSNELIRANLGLSLNAAKIFRLAVMQEKPKDDSDFKPYKLNIRDFGKLINRSGDSLYQDLDRITDELMCKKIIIRDVTDPKRKWIKVNLCSSVLFDKGEIEIMLNNQLKPYLKKLERFYTQYQCDKCMSFKSRYGVDLFELIKLELKNNYLINPGDESEVTIMMDVLRIRTETVKLYPRSSDFKRRVIEPAIKDINELPYGLRILECKAAKQNKKVIAYKFLISSWAAQNPMSKEIKEKVERKKKDIREKDMKKGKEIKDAYLQMDLDDFIKLRGEQ